MKCLGAAFFFLAVFSLWSTTVQDSASITTTASTTRAPSGSPLTTKSVSAATSVSATTAVSLGSTRTSSSNGNKTSQTTPTPVKILSTTNNSTSNSTSTAGTTRLLPPTSETTASKLTPPTIGPTTNITEDFRRNEISQDTTQRSVSGNKDQVLDTPSYTTIILPVIIALIVITLSVCILVALYRICWKTTPERQENETEHTSLDKENVKLISVKTTSPESGEHSSQGKNKTQQHDDSSSHPGNK